MDVRQLRALMDCCRIDQDDWDDQELAALKDAMDHDPAARRLWQQHVAWESDLQAALHDVGVPEGAAARLLEQLESAAPHSLDQPQLELKSALDARPAAAAGQPDVTPRPARGPSSDSRPLGKRRSRRWALQIAGAALATAAVVLLVAWLTVWNDRLTGVQVAEYARHWIGRLDQEKWTTDEPPSARFPLDPGLPFRAMAWQRFEALGSDPAVAYMAELAPDHARAYLLVVRTRRGRHLSSFPPMEPDSTTQGTCIGVWKSNGFLYVLVVPGSRRQYRSLINTHPLA